MIGNLDSLLENARTVISLRNPTFSRPRFVRIMPIHMIFVSFQVQQYKDERCVLVSLDIER